MSLKRIGVLQLIGGFAVEGPRGGAERFGIELAKQLDKSRFDVTVCGLWDYGLGYEKKWIDDLVQSGAQATVLAPRQPNVLRSLLAARRAFLARPELERFDIVHSHFELGDLLCHLVNSRVRHMRRIRTVHNEREWRRVRIIGKLLNTFSLPFFFQTEIGVSKTIIHKLDGRISARLFCKHAHLIPNAIDLSRFAQVDRSTVRKEQARNRLGLPASARVIGIVGRLDPQKGHTYFIQAAQYLAQKISDMQFVIVGTGRLDLFIRGEAERLGILDKVHFLGARTDVDLILPGFDVLVSSSVWEGLSTTIMEGMAAGIPIVATRVSGSEELIDDNVTGLLVQPKSASKLAEAIARILFDEEIRQKMVGSAKSKVRDFDIRTVAEQYSNLYSAP